MGELDNLWVKNYNIYDIQLKFQLTSRKIYIII